MSKKNSLLDIFRPNTSDDESYEDDDYGNDYDDEPENTVKVSRKNKSDDYEDDTYEDKKSVKFSVSKNIKNNFSKKGQPNTMNSNMEVRIFKPSNYNESNKVIDSILAGNSATLNLEGISPELAQRIFDVVAGGVYALDAHMEPLSMRVWLITPNAVNISNDGPITENAAFSADDMLE